MPSIQPPPRDVYSMMRDLHWSPKEKDIAHRAFDRALRCELEATIQEAKQMAEKIKDASEKSFCQRVRGEEFDCR